MAIEERNEKKVRYEEWESIEEIFIAMSCTFHASHMLERLMASRGAPNLADVDMLSMVLPNCIGFWRTFEVISEEDEEAFHAMENKIVACDRAAT